MLREEQAWVIEQATAIAKREIAKAIAAHVHESNEKKAVTAEPVAASVAQSLGKTKKQL